MPERRVWALAVLAALHHVVVGGSIGLGDAEALYLVYARNLQGGYLDHPPLVGLVLWAATALMGNPRLAARAIAALLFGATVLLADHAARRLGGSARAGLASAGALLAVPMFLSGSVAATPDALAAPLCLWALSTAQAATESRQSRDAALAGAVLGLAVLAKVTAVLYAPGLAWLAVRRRARPAQLAVAVVATALVVAPVVLWNVRHGGAMLLHRIVWTQANAGLSLRNLAAFVGGQLAYVGPPMLVALGAVLVRRSPPASEVVRSAALPAVALVAMLGLWSRVAEPHWTATALLPLVVGVGLAADEPLWSTPRVRRLRRFAVGWAVAVAVLLHVLVLTPLAPALVPPGVYDARGDLADELHGWPVVARAVRRARRPGERIAAGHYTMCAQLEIALGRDERVHCLTREVDDWDLWGRGRLPPGTGALFVTDARFPDPPAGAVRLGAVAIERGGRVVRRFVLWRIAGRKARPRAPS